MLFLGILLTGFGSSYYHLDPNDHTLFWDRLPMSISFMAILAMAVEERLDCEGRGRSAVAVDCHWRVQPFAVALDRRSAAVWLGAVLSLHRLAGAFFLFPPKYSGTSYWIIAAALYALAKIFEFYDSAIYSVGSILSGHTLKHIAAAAACFAILRYFQKRQPIPAC